MLNCCEVTRLLSDGHERKLRLKERMHIYLHLLWCRSCRNFGEHMKVIRHITRSYVGGTSEADKKIDAPAE